MVGSRVYVGGLPYGVRERDLERFFKGYGRTRDILIKNGYGFVVIQFISIFSFRILLLAIEIHGIFFPFPFCFLSELQEFEDYRDADDAVYELNGKELLGERYAKKCVFIDFHKFLVDFFFLEFIVLVKLIRQSKKEMMKKRIYVFYTFVLKYKVYYAVQSRVIKIKLY